MRFAAIFLFSFLVAGGLFILSDTILNQPTHFKISPKAPSASHHTEGQSPTPEGKVAAPQKMTEAERLRNKAEDFLRHGNLYRALFFFEKHLELQNADSDLLKRIAIVYHNHAAALYKDEDHDSALEAATRGLEIDPQYNALHKLRAMIFLALAKADDDLETKKDRIEMALQDNEEHVPSLLLAGEIAEQENHIEEALDYFQRAFRVSPQIRGLEKKIAKLQKSALVEEDFVHVEHNHFIARFEGYAQEKLAWIALNILEKAFFIVNERLGSQPNEKITVVIYTGDQFREALNVPDWSGGIYDGKIRIREGDLLQEHNRLRDILYHEYTHALLATTVSRALPTWFNEGIAQIMEPGHHDRRKNNQNRNRLRQARDNNALFTQAQLHGSFLKIENPQIVDLAYGQSVSWVEAMVDTQGYYGLSKLLEELRQEPNFNRAFEKTFHIKLETFVLNWKSSL
jgi:tetratricopeptide (TPR) repeat protein